MTQITFVNLTPEVITLQLEEYRLELQPSGIDTHVLLKEEHRQFLDVECAGVVGSIEIITRSWRKTINLPNPKHNTYYVVSNVVFDLLEHIDLRSDILTPDCGETAVRDDSGKIVAVTALVGMFI